MPRNCARVTTKVAQDLRAWAAVARITARFARARAMHHTCRMPTFAVIGAGAWGTALACHTRRLGHTVRLWAHEPEVAEEIRRQGTNSTFLPGVALPEGIQGTTDLAMAAAGADCLLLVTPSRHLRTIAGRLAPHVPPGALVVIAAKGIDEERLQLMTQVVAETVPAVGADRLAVLSGPTFAAEVSRGLPANVVVASVAAAAARRVQPLLHSSALRVYASADPVGVQVGGALKNVIAIAAGICDGLGLGANARAGLITRGLAEITRLGSALGANPLTFLGMAGVGDLVLTCTSNLSRNRQLGLELAAGADAEAYLAARRSVAEGAGTAGAAWLLAQRLGVEAPITEQVFHILRHDRPLREAVAQLTERSYKDELYGMSDPSTSARITSM
jgi:glycerol-3-phosphate dehydrogenase (NAD(P)+)